MTSLDPNSLDRDLLDAFVPEFEAEAVRLATVLDAAAAARALDQMRAMAGALGAASLTTLVDRAAQALEASDWPALHATAEALARQARAVGAAGGDVVLEALPVRETPAGLIDAEMLAAQAGRVVAAGGDVPAPESPPATGRKRVLVVDDSAMMRRLVRETLALDADFEVVGEAADGVQALAALRDLAPDLTMLDIEMPELDGMGVLRRWALEGGGAVVIVSSAARPGSATAVEARRLGVAGIVGKPSGALSPDLRERQGAALLRTARRAVGLPVEAPR